MKMLNKILFICIVSLTMLSCSIETYSTKKVAADNEIQSYIYDNKYDISADFTGLAYIPLTKGNGRYPKEGDVVAFHYVGYYLDGEKFDSSYDRKYPLIVELGNEKMIKGLEYALRKMDKGAKSKVIVPFYLAYDDMDNAPVPPFSNLIFEIELLDINTKE